MKPLHYLLQPRSPLVFGTGRPLEFGMGGETLSFPYPATVAGALRAAHEVASGRAANAFATNGLSLTQLALARFDWLDPDSAPELLLPRPADAVYIAGSMCRLQPTAMPPDCWTDLPDGLRMLGIVGDSDDLKGKPDSAPAWWTSDQWGRWIADADDACKSEPPYAGPADTRPDTRTHVVMDPLGRGSVDGGLFRTTGRDFGPAEGGTMGHALAVTTEMSIRDAPDGQIVSLDGQARRLGGEGRFVRIESLAEDRFRLPPVPDGLKLATRVRFILTTPAVFPGNGWYPDCLSTLQGAAGAGPRIAGRIPLEDGDMEIVLVAAAISRAQSWSGWTATKNQLQGGPGRPYRVVPAGSVYWFDVAKGDAPRLWRRSLCDPAWAADGWGHGLVGMA